MVGEVVDVCCCDPALAKVIIADTVVVHVFVTAKVHFILA